MKQPFALSKSFRVCSGVLTMAILLLVPRVASAVPFTLVCQPAQETAPSEWFGGQWQRAITIRIDASSRMVELYDEEGKMLAGTLRASRLAGLGGYEFDMRIDENVIRWGVVRMWGISGYVDRKSGRIDVLWTNDDGHDDDTLTRQFHGTCRER